MPCWDNRKVILYRYVLVQHVLRLHVEEAFMVDSLKRNFSRPICVIRNERNRTVNAIYDLPHGQHKWLLVAVKFRMWRKSHFIKTFYGVNEIPKGELIWGAKP